MSDVYELREYVATPGRVEALHKRFEEHSLALFARHGINVVGFWCQADQPERLIYLVRFKEEAARNEAWDNFQRDPEWQEVKRASEANGPLVAEMRSVVLQRIAYFDRLSERAPNAP